MKHARRLLIICICVACCSVASIARPQPDQQDLYQRIELGLREADSLRRAREVGLAWTRLTAVSSLVPSMTTLQRAEYFKVEGDCLYGKDQLSDALVSYRKARSLYSRDTSRAAVTKFVNLHTSIANVFVALGDYQAGRDTARLARQLALDTARLGLGPLQHALRALSGAAERLGDYPSALSASQAALQIINSADGPQSSSAAYVHNQLGVIYGRLGRYTEARSSYQLAADIFAARYGPEHKLTLATLANVASTNDLLGRKDESIPILTRKLNAYGSDPTSNRLATVSTLAELASAQRRIGDLEEALKTNTRALALLREVDDAPPIQEVGLLIKMANLHLGMRDYTGAKPLIDRAVALLHTIPQPPSLETAKLYQLKAQMEAATGGIKNSMPSFAKAYKSLRSNGQLFHRDALILFSQYLRIFIERGDPQRALDTLEVLDKLYTRSLPQLGEVAHPLNALLASLRAEAYVALPELPGDWPQVATRLKVAIDSVHQLVADLPTARHRRQLGSGIAPLGESINALVALELKGVAQQHHTASADLSEALHDLDFYQEHISQLARPVSLRHVATTALPEVKQLREQLASIEQTLAATSARNQAAVTERAALLDSAEHVRQRLATISEGSQRPTPAVATNTQRSRLAYDQLVLAYHVVGSDIYAVVCTRDSVWLRKLGKQTALRQEVDAYLSYCAKPPQSFADDLVALQQGRQLYDQLIGWLGAAQLARTSRIIITNSRPVNGLAFAALPSQISPSPRSYRDVTFAVSQLSFSYARSLSDAFAETIAERSPLTLALIAPRYTPHQSMPALPAVDDELAAIREQLGPQVRPGVVADLAGMLSCLSEANALHLATHAKDNLADGDYSYILLNDSTGQQAQRYFAQALVELPLEAELAVLSACETGAGRTSAGQGILSLANVLRDAGIRTVISTLWSVDDRQSSALVAALYAHLQNPAITVDLALAEAQRQHLAGGASQLQHPYFWSGYTVTGDLTPFGKTSDRSGSYTLWIALGCGLALLAIGLLYSRRKPTLPSDATRSAHPNHREL